MLNFYLIVFTIAMSMVLNGDMHLLDIDCHPVKSTHVCEVMVTIPNDSDYNLMFTDY